MLTKKGKAAIGIALCLSLAAWVTAVAAVYMLVSLLIVLLCYSFLLSRFDLRNIECERNVNDVAFEGDLLYVKIKVTNRGLFSPSYIRCTDFFPPTSPGQQEKSAFIVTLNRKSTLDWMYSARCLKRGLYRLGPLQMVVGDSLGLFRRQQELPTFSRLLVYPTVFEIGDFPFLTKGIAPWFGIETTRISGDDDEFYGVREYRRGDPRSRIHWRSTARLNELIVKQFERSAVHKTTVVLDLKENHDIGLETKTTLEYAVKIAASIAKCLIMSGAMVQLIGYGSRPWILPFGKGTSHLHKTLELLAQVQSDGTTSFTDVLNEISPLVSFNSTLLPIVLDTDIDALKTLASLKARGINIICFILLSATFAQSSEDHETGSIRKEHNLLDITPRSDIKAYFISRGDDLERKFKSLVR